MMKRPGKCRAFFCLRLMAARAFAMAAAAAPVQRSTRKLSWKAAAHGLTVAGSGQRAGQGRARPTSQRIGSSWGPGGREVMPPPRGEAVGKSSHLTRKQGGREILSPPLQEGGREILSPPGNRAVGKSSHPPPSSQPSASSPSGREIVSPRPKPRPSNVPG